MLNTLSANDIHTLPSSQLFQFIWALVTKLKDHLFHVESFFTYLSTTYDQNQQKLTMVTSNRDQLQEDKSQLEHQILDMSTKFLSMLPTLTEFVNEDPEVYADYSPTKLCDFVEVACLMLVAQNQKLKATVSKISQALLDQSTQYREKISQDIIARSIVKETLP